MAIWLWLKEMYQNDTLVNGINGAKYYALEFCTTACCFFTRWEALHGAARQHLLMPMPRVFLGPAGSWGQKQFGLAASRGRVVRAAR